MKKIIYYSVLIILVIVAMVITSTIIGTILGFDSIGVKGLTAGAGLSVVYHRSVIFSWIDKRFK